MLPIYLLVGAAWLAVTPAAQAQDEQQQVQQPDAQSAPPARHAVPRPSAPEPPAQGGQVAPVATSATPPSTAFVDQEQRRAVPRGTRPRGDNPPVGTAVPREGRRDPDPPVNRGGGFSGRDRDRTVIVTRPPIYNNYYYYPRRYYPYGYGAFGLGYFYYDPYRWYPRSYSAFGPGYYGHGYYGSYFDIGELRLDVRPRHAQVFVDGYYAGIVDDYDGMFQGLKLESGPYRIEIAAPGYEPLEFDIRVSPGQKIRYRGDLVRRP